MLILLHVLQTLNNRDPNRLRYVTSPDYIYMLILLHVLLALNNRDPNRLRYAIPPDYIYIHADSTTNQNTKKERFLM